MKNLIKHPKIAIVILTILPSLLTVFVTSSPSPALIIGEVKLGGFVWEDLNHNGIQDPGEPGLAGVMVQLFDSANNYLGNVYALADGSYSFVQTQVGGVPYSYYIKFTQLPGFAFTIQHQGSDPSKDSDPNPTTGLTDVITITGGENLTINAGMTAMRSIAPLLLELLD